MLVQESKGKLLRWSMDFLVLMLILTFVTNTTATITVPVVKTQKLISRSLVHIVEGEGKIEPKAYNYIFGEPGFSLSHLGIKEGDYVEEGTYLFTLNLDEIEKTLVEEELKLKKIRITNQKEEAGLIESQVEIDLKRAKEDYQNFINIGEKELLETQKEYLKAEETLNTFLDKYEKNEETQILFELSPEEILLLQEYIKMRQEVDGIKDAYEQLEMEKQKKKMERKQELNQARLFDINNYFNLLDKHPIEEQEENKALEKAENKYKKLKKEYDKLTKEIKESENLNALIEGNQNQILTYQIEFIKNYNMYKKDYENKKEKYEKCLGEYEIKLQEKQQEKDRKIEDAQLALDTHTAKEKERVNSKEQERQLLQIDSALQELRLKPLRRLWKRKGVFDAKVKGYISKVNMKIGDVCTTLPVLEISNEVAGYRFTCEISEKEKEFINVGDKVTLTNKKGEKVDSKLKVSALSKSKDKEETYEVEVDLGGDFKEYRGKTFKMKCVSDTKAFSICIPISALNRDSAYYVFVIEEKKGVLGKQMVARRVDVTLLDKADELVAVEGPITAEDKIITESSKWLHAGDRVRLKP